MDSSGFSLGGMVGWHHNGLIHDSKCETKLKVNSTENYGELIAPFEKRRVMEFKIAKLT